jgi:hypothetical protein
MPYLHANDMSVNKFLGLVGDFSWPEEALLSAFSPSEARFDYFHSDEAFLSATESGRIFFPDGELKWRKLDGLIRVVFLGNARPPLGLDDFSSDLEGLASVKAEYFLWGERTEKAQEWIEQQVPHRFSYPFLEKNFSCGRVALVVEKWMDSTDLVGFSRYHSIKETPGGKNAPR